MMTGPLLKKNGIRGMYELGCILNHDCVGNTVHQFTPLESGFGLVMRAGCDIKQGEEITHSYIDPMDSFLKRQDFLKLGKLFDCTCSRCSDPTELGSYASALKCPACKNPVVTLDCSTTKSDWSCTNCPKIFPFLKISALTEAVYQEAEVLEERTKTSGNNSIPDHEAFIGKFSTVLHPGHVILIMVKYNLARMYGKMAG